MFGLSFLEIFLIFLGIVILWSIYDLFQRIDSNSKRNKEIRRKRNEEEAEYKFSRSGLYKLKVRCSNCGHQGTININKGKKLKSCICPNCRNIGVLSRM